MNDHRPHQAMGAGHEFDMIRLLMARSGDLAVDIGDDAAVLLPEGQTRRVITTDACVEDVHFRRAWISPRQSRRTRCCRRYQRRRGDGRARGECAHCLRGAR